MEDKIHNLIADPNVYFYLHPTPKLKELVATDAHPHLKTLRADVKAHILDGKALVLDKQDVLQFVKGGLPESERFLLKTGDIRVIGTPSINLNENKGS